MMTQKLRELFGRLFGPVRVTILLVLVIIIYLLPLNSKSEFIQQNRQIVEVPHTIPILKSIYPEGAYATCGQDGDGENCQTGCCSAGQCVVCPPGPEDEPPRINAALNCSQPGTNGWCIGSLSIDLSASDPQGYSIVISGILNDTDVFACPVGAKTCSIPVNAEGEGTISYRVDSSSGMAHGGSKTYKVDWTTPQLDGVLGCVMGNNNWCRSNATLEAISSDSLSGVAFITTTINGGAQNTYTGPITLADGVHSVTITASDNAGNTVQTTQVIQVDTINPNINVSLSGKNGNKGWYVSKASATATATDAGSGLYTLEAKLDGGTWSMVTGPLSFSNGIHTYELRAVDQAGNVTGTQAQTIKMDTIAPAIDMTEELDLGDTLYHSLQDDHSGLSVYRAVIEDDEERYQKVVWVDALTGNKSKGEILWDGRFKDGTMAGSGDYFITLKISDAAGNETMKSAVVHVNAFSFLQSIPSFTLPTSALPEDAADQLSQTDAETQTVTSFGGTSSPVEGEHLPVGSFGVPSSTTPVANTPIDPNILWGLAAVTVLGSTLAAWEEARKRKEEAEAREQARLERQARQRAQADAEAEAKRQLALAIQQAAQSQHMENKMAQFDAMDDAQWTASQIAIAQQAQNNASNLGSVSASVGTSYSNWLTNLWNTASSTVQTAASAVVANISASVDNVPIPAVIKNTSSWVNTNIIQPVNDFIYEPFVKPIVAQVQQSPVYTTIQSALAPKNIVPTLLTLALGANTVQWVSNIANNENLFTDAYQNAQQELAQLYELHPKTEENTQLLYLFTNPYEVVQIGYETTKTFANIAAGYADAILQENPVGQAAVEALQDMGDQCSEGAGEAWARRCSAAFYFVADVIENPMDTLVGVGTALIADPTAGAIKTAAYIYENLNVYELTTDIIQNGWTETVQDRKEDFGALFSDPAVQAFLFLTVFTAVTLAGAGIVALAAGGLLVSWQAANLINQIDSLLQSAPTRADAMKAITDPKLRRQIVTTIVLLGLVIFGGAKTLKEFNVFQGSLSPSAQQAFADLSPFQQIKLFETAGRLNVSSEVLEFYLAESLRPGSPFAKFSLTDALYLSDLSIKSGAGDFMLAYLDRFGSNSATLNILKNTSPEALKYLGEEFQNPASPIRNLPLQDQLNVVQEGFNLGWAGDRINSYVDTYYNQYPPQLQEALQSLPVIERMQLVGSTIELQAKNSSGPWQYSLEKLIDGVADEGPLNVNAVKTFDLNQYNVVTLEEPALFYRLGYSNSGTNGLGRSLSFEPPISEINGRINYAIEMFWRDPDGYITGSSPIDTAYVILVREGTTIYVGPAGGRGGMFVGNGIQVYVPDIFRPGVGQVVGEWGIPVWEINDQYVPITE